MKFDEKVQKLLKEGYRLASQDDIVSGLLFCGDLKLMARGEEII